MRDDDHEIMVKTRGSLISVLSGLKEDLKSLPAHTNTHRGRLDEYTKELHGIE